jgi:ferredoxin-NADP reductase
VEAVRFESRILGSSRETGEVRTIKLEVPPGFHFTPGQWVMLNFEDDPKTSRAYSIASSPLETGAIEVTLSRVGDFSERLFRLGTGGTIVVRGPYGKWIWRDDVTKAALVSGGSGVGPFRSMIRYALGKKLPVALSLFYALDHTGEVIYEKELAEFEKAGVKVRILKTAPTADSLAAELPDAADTDFFLCGPTKLVAELTEGLAAQGVPRAKIHFEKWGDYQL